VFYNHPGFIEPMVDRVADALAQIPAERRGAANLAFTAHSIPCSMAQGSRYETQLAEACRLVVEGVAARGLGNLHWRLVYQSRSGPPTQPWLEPDIGEHLRGLKSTQVQDVVVAPIGFISDHMEVLFDLDTEAKQICGEIGLNMVRAGTVGCHPRFVTMIRELIVERQSDSPARLALGTMPANHDFCPLDCCPAPPPRRPTP
jgi:ferrochelatase